MARKSPRGGQRASWQNINSDILSALDLRSEFADLGIEITESSSSAGENGWLECWACDRPHGNHPSAAVNVHTGRYRDLGGVGLSLSFWDLAVHLGRFQTWQEARKAYAEKAGVKLADSSQSGPDSTSSASGKRPLSHDPAEHLTFKPWSPMLAALFCRSKAGVTPESIQAAGGRLATYRDQYSVVSLPIFGPDFTDGDPVGWVLWNVTGGKLPVWSKANQQPSMVKMKTTGGSDAGLLGQWAIDRIQRYQINQESPPQPLVVWKVEGPSDALALWSSIPPALRDTHLIITNAGGSNQHPRDWMVPAIAGHVVHVLHDCDQPGQEGATRWSTWAAAYAHECRNVILPFPIAKDHGKDLRDWLAEGHTYQELLELAGVVVPLPKPDPSSPESQQPTEQDTASLQAVDDPHRLARVNLERYATITAGRTLRFWRDEWYTWKGGRYRSIGEKELRAKLSASIKEEFDRVAATSREAFTRGVEAGVIGSDKEPPQSRKVSKPLVSNVLEATASMVVLSSHVELGTWLPTRERRKLISLRNGLLDISSFLAGGDYDDCVLPHSPDWWSTVSLPYEFDPAARCPLWEAFLEHNLELDPERIKVLQEWAGYLLLPDTGEQKFMVLEGEGANGKSVFIAGLTAMLGEDNVSTVPLEVFGDRFSRTDSLGKLLNAAGDCAELDKAAEGYIKSFTSGDRMFFDRKGVPGIVCRPTARLMVACNNRPRFSDRSQGVFRRMLVVPWRVEITKEKRVKGMDKVEWWQESGELPGILDWALVGLARLKSQGGFTDSAIMQEALQDYQEEMNPARVFLTQYVEPCKDGGIKAASLYSHYRDWAKENGYHPLSERPFGKEVRRVFKTASRRNGGSRDGRYWWYEGVRYTQDEIAGKSTAEDLLF